jgi:hypothetical protein
LIPYVLEKFQAIIAMGVCLEKNQDQFDIRVVIRTNGSEEVRALQYGGHPGNAQRWAVNIALDTLRQWLVKLKSNKGIQPD